MASGSVEYIGDYVEKKILRIKRRTPRIKTFAMMIFEKLSTFKSFLYWQPCFTSKTIPYRRLCVFH